ncbi:hypothetical protein ACLOJK_008704 [Asimina triloba]
MTVVAQSGLQSPPRPTAAVVLPSNPVNQPNSQPQTGGMVESGAEQAAILTTGSCGTALNCSTLGNYPATLAEFSISYNSSVLSFYDVTVVSGYNLPVVVTPVNGRGNCSLAGCDDDMVPNCPSELAFVAGGKTVACKSACQEFGTNEHCCFGVFGNPTTCQSTPYSKIFKSACPAALSYAYEAATGLLACYDVDFLVTFCAYRGVVVLNSSSPSSWSNNNSVTQITASQDSSTISLILSRGTDPDYSLGFFCTGSCDSYYFSLVVGGSLGNRLVWTANRDNPVRRNAKLELTQTGDLVLLDPIGTKVWSTDTAGKSVAGMNISAQGNLILFNDTGGTVWQSFDDPVDVLLPGQKLYDGQRLVASASATNWSKGSTYYASMTSRGFAAFIEGKHPLMYFLVEMETSQESTNSSNYMEFEEGRLVLHSGASETTFQVSSARSVLDSSHQHIRLEPDGHMRLFLWRSLEGWYEQADLVVQKLDECQYPHSCGDFGVCSDGQCSCPVDIDRMQYFNMVDSQLPNKGCSRIMQLSCEASTEAQLVDFGNLSYFNLIDPNAAVPGLNDLDGCKQACLQNCSCEAAFFKNEGNFPDGHCYLISHVLSIRAKPIPGYNFSSSAFIKVRKSKKRRNLSGILAGSGVGIALFIFLLVAVLFVIYRKRRHVDENEHFNLIPGMPMKFSYEDLRMATDDFREKLGRGGFGSVFSGTLADGTKIAVKRLENVGQGMKEFLAEVETIGSIHHINLVRLIGYCAEKSHRLLVYEHMSNGSLDNWIFNKSQHPALYWQTRKQIILDVAKGLAYLHEECRQRIVHLDIKPQNILLDDRFNAKVSDFGLSQLINRDQSQVLTNMRGTPGYLAPEWHQLRITEKTDIYSFGVVVLEIVCGRRNFDYSRGESSAHLLSLLEKKAEEDRLIDIVDNTHEDLRLHGEEAVKMIRMAAWCLQIDHTKRPRMSDVVKVLEGVMDVDPSISFRYSDATVPPPMETDDAFLSELPQASILSGPR